ncbi:MAG TPA: SMC family ATPase [Gemmatimonadaceae bacterium]|nr:SMC family ATPase [Gemmatimonadaceae bacterium]
MRLNSVRLTNFRLHADTRIEFDTGLTGIIGPNGSGKTTILEAIAWALYGMPAARGKRQDIRSLSASGRAGVKVELDFDLSGHRHRVVRSLSSAELYLDGAATPIANSTSAVTDILRRRMGMTQQEFFNTYFTGQKELGVMAAMGPAERSQFLSRVLGYERLTSARGLVRERRNVLKGELAGLESALPDSDAVARELKESAERLKDSEGKAKTALTKLKKASEASLTLQPKWIEAQKERDAHQKTVAELRVREGEEAALARDSERLDRDLAEIIQAQKEILEISEELNIHSDLAARLHEMERLFQEEGRRKELLRNRQALDADLTKLRERLRAIDVPADAVQLAERARDALRRQLDEANTALDAAHTDWVRDRQEAMTKRQALLDQHKEIREQREQLANLGPESPCPICTRPLADHFREVLDDLDGKLTAIEVDGKYYRKRVEQLEETPAPLRELQERVATLEESLDAQAKALTTAQLRQQEHTQLTREVADREKRLAALVEQLEGIPSGYHETRHAQLRQQHAQLAPLAERSVRLRALTEREPRIRKDADKARKDLARVRTQLEELRQRQKESKFSEQSFAKLKASHEAAAAELRSCELAALGAEKELEAARAARSAAEASRQELDRGMERLRALTLDRRLHEELDRAFTDIRASLNEHLRPEISDLASGFLAELTDGRYTDLELDDDYNIIVKEDDIPKPVISGGEEDLANLVLRLAISQMIAERAGQAFSLLILDEVFGSLDESRRHNVVELLRKLHDRFEQVILITHIESVREGLDRVLSVRYDAEAGISRVEQELGGAGMTDEVAEDAYVEAGAAG